MATSSKVVFKLDTLRAQALSTLEERIRRARLELENYLDPEVLEQLDAEWRETQIQKVLTLARELQDNGDAVTNRRLEGFRLDKRPEQDQWDRRHARRALDELLTLRDKVEAKSASLHPNEDGCVALTKTQLRDFFAL